MQTCSHQSNQTSVKETQTAEQKEQMTIKKREKTEFGELVAYSYMSGTEKRAYHMQQANQIINQVWVYAAKNSWNKVENK